MKDYKNQQKQFRDRARAIFLPQVKDHPTEDGVEVLLLSMGHAKPAVYARVKIPLPLMMRGRRATFPLRRIR